MVQNLPPRDSTEPKNNIVNLTGEEKVSRGAILKGKCSHPLCPNENPWEEGSVREGGGEGKYERGKRR